MALVPTLYQFDLAIENVDRGISEALQFRTARHPSEAMDRVWLRVLAYAWQWSARLESGAGLSDPDAADLQATSLTGDVTHWVRVGKADPGKIQRIVDHHHGAKVAVLFESPLRLSQFLAASTEFPRSRAAELCVVDPVFLAALAANEQRRQRAAITLVGDHFYVDRDGVAVDGPLTRG